LTREAIDDCAIGLRYAIDTLDEPYGLGDRGIRATGEGAEIIALLDPLVDYWDINVGTINWGEDAGPSRFFATNHEAAYGRMAKSIATKPVVSVGRFTDPDVMAEAVRSCQCDFIGAARPSIADPFSSRRRSPRGEATRSASASAATSASHAGKSGRSRSGARRTRPPAKSTGAAGIRSGSPGPRTPRATC
jgi:2,4-dienoyl-CoA reductase-like NADH-dependent reductase (Old Yellow Enzyme family)